eukprot:CAMPEP_0168606908 /NCGR_PEP_ID=MMETSP0420-20121227/16845_1 /TAXON_ID=498008 /ORGANISM="Pessonella sp." /LENGTH=96 /DNA_ID=CAMNT_0008646651 /DNA_START=86 /DNA_END=376 /DNA_ORIENTATION=-
MPHVNLLTRFQNDLILEKHLRVNGQHYAKTLEAWLKNMDANLKQIRPLFATCYGEKNVECWVARWRMFYMACAELFNYNQGNEWFVSFYLFSKRND